MELIRTNRWFYFLTMLLGLTVLTLGSWWLFLIYKLSTILQDLNLPEHQEYHRFLNMIRWEGAFFLLMIIISSISLLFIYWRDNKKTNALQAFFSSLTHELKTPLASMRLQAEVIKDLIQDESHDHTQLTSLTGKLIEDTSQFESELDKNLQLSRIEQDAEVHLDSISLQSALKKILRPYTKDLTFEYISQNASTNILADETALKTIFKNLAENTIRHSSSLKKVTIEITSDMHFIHLTYNDYGGKFQGDTKKLSQLFYKFNSKKGSGIGLYIIKQLLKKMGGNFITEAKPNLIFTLSFRKGENNE